MLIFGKGGVHEIGTVVFTVIAWGRRASARNIGFAEPKCKLDAKTVMPPAVKRPRLRYAIAEFCFGSARGGAASRSLLLPRPRPSAADITADIEQLRQ